MDRAVLISIRPEWVEKILDGEKALEVRKNRPNMEPPFKYFIYCTNNGGCLANRDAYAKDVQGIGATAGIVALTAYESNARPRVGATWRN